MSVSGLEAADVDWIVELLRERRDPLVRFAPVFWRPAPDAAARHREFLEHLLTKAGAQGFRTDASVLVAVPRGEGWLVDDMHVRGAGWVGADGGALWNALDGVAHGAPVRFVCPAYEPDRVEFARAAGLEVAESWWLLELPGGPGGGEAGAHVELAGTMALTVAAPLVYDPGGPVLYLPAFGDATAGLRVAARTAPELGCPAIVVNHVAGDARLERALVHAGFRRHCDYYAGTIDSV